MRQRPSAPAGPTTGRRASRRDPRSRATRLPRSGAQRPWSTPSRSVMPTRLPGSPSTSVGVVETRWNKGSAKSEQKTRADASTRWTQHARSTYFTRVHPVLRSNPLGAELVVDLLQRNEREVRLSHRESWPSRCFSSGCRSRRPRASSRRCSGRPRRRRSSPVAVSSFACGGDSRWSASRSDCGRVLATRSRRVPGWVTAQQPPMSLTASTADQGSDKRWVARVKAAEERWIRHPPRCSMCVGTSEGVVFG